MSRRTGCLSAPRRRGSEAEVSAEGEAPTVVVDVEQLDLEPAMRALMRVVDVGDLAEVLKCGVTW
jgi:hypothetical protein